MLAPDDRSILIDLLRPPVGYSLDRAVGTTFSLDLRSALAVPLAFAAHRASTATDPIAVMEAVRSASQRVDIFFQAGQVKVPTQASDLVAFLEPMVHATAATRPGYLFHPKVWVLRFVADDDGLDDGVALRLLCLTRNLTDDASWDVAVRLDGWETSAPKGHNKPIADFLRALPDLAVAGSEVTAERRGEIGALAESVRYAEWEFPDGVTELLFHALGIPKGATKPDFKGRRRLVIAPFCNDDGLEIVVPADCHDTTLVAGATDLDRLDAASLARLQTYVVSATAGLDPDAADDPSGLAVASGGHVIRGGLHAKVTVMDRARRAVVVVGSANATDAAYGGNVEFLVEMRGSPAKLGVEAVLDMDTGLGRILERYETEGGAEIDASESALHELQTLVRRAAAAGWVLTLTGGPTSWQVSVETDSAAPPGTSRLTVELLSLPGRALDVHPAGNCHGSFTDVATADVSPFLVLRATTVDPEVGELSWSTVVRAALRNDPVGRLDEILARQIDTPEKLLRFLMLILGLGQLDLVALDGGAGEPSKGWSFGRSGSTGLFEALVRALVEQPKAFDDIERLVERLRSTGRGRETLPAGFETLWASVSEARLLIQANAALGSSGEE